MTEKPVLNAAVDALTDKLIELGRKSASGQVLILDKLHVKQAIEEALSTNPAFTLQLRSEASGIQHVPTLAEALRVAQADPTIWKVSFSLPTGERVRLVKRAVEMVHNRVIYGWELEPVLPSGWSGGLCSTAPDTCWIDDVTGEHVDANTGQRTPEHPVEV